MGRGLASDQADDRSAIVRSSMLLAAGRSNRATVFETASGDISRSDTTQLMPKTPLAPARTAAGRASCHPGWMTLTIVRRSPSDASARDCWPALKAVSFNEQFFQGHFPGKPIMPGVLQIEALAQAAAILAIETLELAGSDASGGLSGLLFCQKWIQSWARSLYTANQSWP